MSKAKKNIVECDHVGIDGCHSDDCFNCSECDALICEKCTVRCTVCTLPAFCLVCKEDDSTLKICQECLDEMSNSDLYETETESDCDAACNHDGELSEEREYVYCSDCEDAKFCKLCVLGNKCFQCQCVVCESCQRFCLQCGEGPFCANCPLVESEPFKCEDCMDAD